MGMHARRRVRSSPSHLSPLGADSFPPSRYARGRAASFPAHPNITRGESEAFLPPVLLEVGPESAPPRYYRRW
jgi:hypothetical protein